MAQKPFFAYYAPAPHMPHITRPRVDRKIQRQVDQGWDKQRRDDHPPSKRRWHRSCNTQLTTRSEGIDSWEFAQRRREGGLRPL